MMMPNLDEARAELASYIAAAEEAEAALIAARDQLRSVRQHPVEPQHLAALQNAITLAREVHAGRALAVDQAAAKVMALLALDHAETTLAEFESLVADVSMYSLAAERARAYGACPELLRRLVKGPVIAFAVEYSGCFPSFSKRASSRLDSFMQQLKANPMASL